MPHWATAAAGMLCLTATLAWSGTVKLTVTEPSGVARKGWPVTSGIPFAQGALRDHEASALFGPDGKQMPLQTEVLATWPDGSVRWLLLDFQVDLKLNEKKVFELLHGAGVTRSPIVKPVRVEKEDNAIRVNTGPLEFWLHPNSFVFLDEVKFDLNGDGRFADEEVLLRNAMPGICVVDEQGKPFGDIIAHSRPAQIAIEQAGPLRACARIEGQHFSGQGHKFGYVLRIHAFRAQPFLRVFYTFINDDQASLMSKVKKIRLGFALGGAAGTRIANIHDGQSDDKWNGATRTVLQVDDQRCVVNGVLRNGKTAGWAAVGGEKAGSAVGLREFWQNWPKGIELDTGGIYMGICPAIPAGLYRGKPIEEENKLYYHVRDGLYTFKVGVAKTHELWATCFLGYPNNDWLKGFFRAAEDPLLATCEPAYVSTTKALGEFPPADPKKYAGYDAQVDKALADHLRRRDKGREYGMLNYGDWYGERGVNWGNLEYDLAHGLFLQYLRTGDRRFFLRAEQAARHHIDVDVVHATNPHLKNPWGPPPRVGEIWLHALNHTGGYYDEKTSGLPVSRTYHMGHSTNFGHVWVTGDLDYYHLTGDRRAREVALQMADAMVRHMPNRYGTHIRALGWPMILVLAAYEATGDKKYLDAATKNWQVLKKNIDWKKGWVIRLAKGHCLHPTRQCFGNVPFMEGQTCGALARYHRITKDPEVLRAISVGIDQMIRECWQEDVKTFRYTACPLSSKAPYALFLLSAEAMAYEVAHTGNREHRRVLREGLRAAIHKSAASGFGKSLGQTLFFTPHGLAALED